MRLALAPHRYAPTAQRKRDEALLLLRDERVIHSARLVRDALTLAVIIGRRACYSLAALRNAIQVRVVTLRFLFINFVFRPVSIERVLIIEGARDR